MTTSYLCNFSSRGLRIFCPGASEVSWRSCRQVEGEAASADSKKLFVHCFLSNGSWGFQSEFPSIRTHFVKVQKIVLAREMILVFQMFQVYLLAVNISNYFLAAAL